MKKLNWERNYNREGMQDREHAFEVWSAKWWIIWCHVHNQSGKWVYIFNGAMEIISRKEYDTKEDAFDGAENRIESVCRAVIYPAMADK